MQACLDENTCDGAGYQEQGEEISSSSKYGKGRRPKWRDTVVTGDTIAGTRRMRAELLV